MKCKTIPDLERFLLVQEQALGPSAPEVASTLSKLAELHYIAGSLEKAEALFQRAYDIRSELSGFHREGIDENQKRLEEIKAKRLGNGVPSSSGKTGTPDTNGPQRDSAISAETISVSNPVAPQVSSSTVVNRNANNGAGDSPPKRSGSATDLDAASPASMRISNAKQIASAIQDYEVELELLKQMVGESHPSVADLLTKVADLYCRLRMYSKMEPLLVEALKIRETNCGPEHPSVSTELKNLGALYCVQERFALAEPLLKRSIAIRERTYGHGHPRVADVQEQYATLLRKTNRIALAEALEKHVDEIRNSYEAPGFARNNTFHSAGS